MGSIKSVISVEYSRVKLLELNSRRDFRGENTKIFSKEDLDFEEISFSPIEILAIHSNKNVLRGLHYQQKYQQSRMLICTKGVLFCVMVDLDNINQPELMCVTYILSDCNQGLYVPAGFALGTYAIEDTDFICMCGEHPYKSEYSKGIIWNDETIDIDWPMCGDPIISEVDKKWPGIRMN